MTLKSTRLAVLEKARAQYSVGEVYKPRPGFHSSHSDQLPIWLNIEDGNGNRKFIDRVFPSKHPFLVVELGVSTMDDLYCKALILSGSSPQISYVILEPGAYIEFSKNPNPYPPSS